MSQLALSMASHIDDDDDFSPSPPPVHNYDLSPAPPNYDSPTPIDGANYQLSSSMSHNHIVDAALKHPHYQHNAVRRVSTSTPMIIKPQSTHMSTPPSVVSPSSSSIPESSPSLIKLNDRRVSHTLPTIIVMPPLRYRLRDEGTTRLQVHASPLHIYSLSVILCIAGCSISWQLSLAAGAGPAIIAAVWVGLAYVALMSCISELASQIPFSGGAYGFVRATLGHFPSLIVGLAETLEYVVSHITFALASASMITSWFETDPALECVWMLMLYIAWTCGLLKGGKWFWHSTIVGMVICLGTIVAYWIITITASPSLRVYGQLDPALDASANIAQDPAVPRGIDAWFTSGAFSTKAQGFFSVLPIGIWWYCGVEAIPLASEETFAPRRNIARGVMPAIWTVIFASVCTLLCGASIGPNLNALIQSSFPMTQGMMTILKPSLVGSAFVRNWTMIFSLPGVIFVGFGTFFASSRIVYALARAGYFHNGLSMTLSNGVPIWSVLLNAVFGFSMTLIVRLVSNAYPANDTMYVMLTTIIFNMLILGCILTYIIVFISFIVMRVTYWEVPREFVSPYGIAGAIFGIITFAVCLVSMCIYQPYMLQAFYGICIYYALGAIQYYVYSQWHRYLSPEEHFAMSLKITSSTMFQSGLGIACMLEYCRSEFSTENVTAWQAIEFLKSNLTVSKFDAVMQAHFFAHAVEQVNVSHESTAAMMKVYANLHGESEAPSLLIKQRRVQIDDDAPLGGTNDDDHAHDGDGIDIIDSPIMSEPKRLSVKSLTKQQHVRTGMRLTLSNDITLDEEKVILQSCLPILASIQRELVGLIDRDTLPRMKRSLLFARYLATDPLAYQNRTLSVAPSRLSSRPASRVASQSPSPDMTARTLQFADPQAQRHSVARVLPVSSMHPPSMKVADMIDVNHITCVDTGSADRGRFAPISSASSSGPTFLSPTCLSLHNAATTVSTTSSTPTPTPIVPLGPTSVYPPSIQMLPTSSTTASAFANANDSGSMIFRQQVKMHRTMTLMDTSSASVPIARVHNNVSHELPLLSVVVIPPVSLPHAISRPSLFSLPILKSASSSSIASSIRAPSPLPALVRNNVVDAHVPRTIVAASASPSDSPIENTPRRRGRNASKGKQEDWNNDKQ